jgi:hypothetical protein
VVPVLLISLVLVVTATAAAIAVTSGPSSDQAILRRAATVTLSATGFDFHSVGSRSVSGTYRAPDSLDVQLPRPGPTESLFEVFGGSGPTGFLRSQMNGSGYPNVPPLAAVTAATDVARTGNTYTFVIPAITLLQPSGEHPSTSYARNTPAQAVVNSGRVVALVLPRGVHAGGLGYKPSKWVFSNFEASSTSAPWRSFTRPPPRPAPCPTDVMVPTMATGSFCGPQPTAGNGLGPDGQCTGQETGPPCGPGVVVNHYYAFTLPGTCNGLIVFDGRRWVSELPPPTPVPDLDVWMRLTSTGTVGFIGPKGAVGFVPYTGQTLAGCGQQ